MTQAKKFDLVQYVIKQFDLVRDSSAAVHGADDDDSSSEYYAEDAEEEKLNKKKRDGKLSLIQRGSTLSANQILQKKILRQQPEEEQQKLAKLMFKNPEFRRFVNEHESMVQSTFEQMLNNALEMIGAKKEKPKIRKTETVKP